MTPRWWAQPLIAPIAVAVAAWGLFVVSDRLLYIGPFDQATFGWLVVAPVWLLVPVAAAFAGQRLSAPGRRRAALGLAVVVATAAAALLWSAITSDTAACAVGPRTPVEGWIIPSLVLGAVIGAAPALSSWLATRTLVERGPVSAVAMGIASDAALSTTALLIVTVVVLGLGGCERPHIR